MKNFFDDAELKSITERLNGLDGNEKRLWGKMTLSQMLRHCRLQLEMGLNVIPSKAQFPASIQWLTKQTVGFLIPWPRNLITAPEMVVKDDAEFVHERSLLLQRITETVENDDIGSHPFFGQMNKEEWGKVVYKHLDHHLKQFGA
jgi:hypothetical protein